MNFSAEIAGIRERVDFSPLQGKTILMTGGSGFVGHWMQMPVREGRVLSLTHIGFDAWRSDTHSTHYDYIIHLAPYIDDHVLRLFEKARPKAVLLASSGAVYNKRLNDYGRAKLDAENMLLAGDVDVRIARMFAFCGPYLRPDNFCIGNFVRNAIRGEPLNVLGTGNGIRTYMYGADLSVWLWSILLKGDTDTIYNVGSETPITFKELARTVVDTLHSNSKIQRLNIDFIEPQPNYVPNTSATRDRLNVTCVYPLEYQIERYAEWLKESA